jgi:hypothetical protein
MKPTYFPSLFSYDVLKRRFSSPLIQAEPHGTVWVLVLGDKKSDFILKILDLCFIHAHRIRVRYNMTLCKLKLPMKIKIFVWYVKRGELERK